MAALDLARALDPHKSTLRPLPADVRDLLVSLRAPARLAAHLRAVHDVAWQLTEQMKVCFPALAFDGDAVLYGAATHDIGKIDHPDELTGPGHQHEPAGYRLLIARGVPARGTCHDKCSAARPGVVMVVGEFIARAPRLGPGS